MSRSLKDAGPERRGSSPRLGDKDHPRAEHVFKMAACCRKLSALLPGRWDRRARDLGKAIVNYRGARRSYARLSLFALLARRSDVLLTPFGDARLLVPTADREIGRIVFATGGYERLYMDCAVAELRRLGFDTEGKTFVDVGANIGTSTVDALVHFGFGKAVCFEPDERSFHLLLANVAVNGLGARVETHPFALSDSDSVTLLERSPTNWADNRIVNGDGPGPNSDQVVPIGCRRFDTLVAEGLLSVEEIGLLWLDTQGHECHVVRGAARALEAGIPIVLEYAPNALEANGDLEDLHGLVAANYTTVIDLHLLAAGLRSRAVLSSSDLGRLRDHAGREHTDVLLVRSPA